MEGWIRALSACQGISKAMQARPPARREMLCAMRMNVQAPDPCRACGCVCDFLSKLQPKLTQPLLPMTDRVSYQPPSPA